MNLLILGGTRFIGRATTEAALAAGHQVTLFHRGQSGADLYPIATHVLGDRDGGLDALEGLTFDAVIDTCGYHPRIVRQSAEALRGKAQHYLFVSTVSVYEDNGEEWTEDSPLKRFVEEPESEAITADTYGEFKVQCEEVVKNLFDGIVTHVRPGYVIGRWDVTDRYTYWVDRLLRPEKVLLPAPASQLHQGVDVRDLGAFIIQMVESQTPGYFNVASPNGGLPFHEWLNLTDTACGGKAEKVLVEEPWLLSQNVAPGKDLPMWVPSAGDAHLKVTNIDRALAQGLKLHSVEETLADLIEWYQSRDSATTLKAGMSRERELELIDLVLKENS